MIDRGKKRNSARTEKSALTESGRGYAVVLTRGFALGGEGAPVFIVYRHRAACAYRRELAKHGLRGRVVRVEWRVREVRS